MTHDAGWRWISNKNIMMSCLFALAILYSQRKYVSSYILEYVADNVMM